MAEQFIKVYDWMMRLGIPGRELLVYALIYSFTEQNKPCVGQKYISDRTGIEKSDVSKILKRLEEKYGLIRKERLETRFAPYSYYSNKELAIYQWSNTNGEIPTNSWQNTNQGLANYQLPVGKIPTPFIKNKNIDKNIDKNTHKNNISDRDAIFEMLAKDHDLLPDDKLLDSIQGFIQHRKTLKKPLTERALKLNVNKAYELAGGDQDKMTALFDQTVERGWQGIYEEKGKSDGTKRSDSFFKDDD